MKNGLLFLIMVVHSLALYSQLTKDSLGCIPLISKFQSPDATIINPVWDFGDGASSQKINPTHVFVDTGLFTVRLLSNGVLLYEQKIKVLPEVKLDFIASDYVGCSPINITFTNQTIKPDEINSISYFWDFGDGSFSSSTSPAHNYIDEGVFKVTLSALTNIELCNNSISKDSLIRINGTLNAKFSIDSITPPCQLPATTYITNNSSQGVGIQYNWNFGDGQTSSVEDPGIHIYNNPGIYTINLTLTNDKDCVAPFSRVVNIKNKNSMFNVSYPDTHCIGIFIPLVNQSAQGEYTWTFGDQASQAVSNLKEPENIHYNSLGVQSFNLSIKTPECTVDSTFYIAIIDTEVAFDIVPGKLCQAPTEVKFIAKDTTHLLYFWDGVLGEYTFTQAVTSPERDSFYYNYAQNFPVNFRAKSKNNCFNSDDKLYILDLPDAQYIVSDHHGLVPLKVDIQDVSKANDTIIEWIFTWGDGSQSVYDTNTISFASHTYNQTGKYYINLSIKTIDGCYDNYYGAWIEVGAPLQDTITDFILQDVQSQYCLEDTLRFKVENYPLDVDAFHFNVDNHISHCEKDNQVTHVLLDRPGVFRPEVDLERNGVFAKYTLPSITVKGAKANIAYKVDCTKPYVVDFRDSSFNANLITWTIENKTITSSEFSYDFKKPGTYSIALKAENTNDGCKPSYDTVTVILSNLQAKINMNDTWCSNEEVTLDATGSTDVFATCLNGYTWFFPKEINQRPIQSGNPIKETYLPAGSYPLGLEVTDINGCKDTTFLTITNHTIEAVFDMNHKEFCEPIKVDFTDQSQSSAAIKEWQWSFNSNVNSPTVSYIFQNLPEDTLFLDLKVTNVHGCQDDTTVFALIYQPTTAILGDRIFCYKNTVRLKANDYTEKGSNLNFLWTIPGYPNSSSQNPEWKDLLPGSYKINLKATEQSTGCTIFDSTSITIIQRPEAGIEKLMDTVFCYPKTLLLKSKATADSLDQISYSWNFGNGVASSKIDPAITYDKGEYNIRLIVRSKYNCSDTAFQKVKLIGPEGILFADKSRVCVGEPINFTLFSPKDVNSFFWDFGQGEVNANQNPVGYSYDFYPPTGKTFASLVLYSQETGCESVLTTPIEIYKLQAAFDSVSSCETNVLMNNFSLGNDLNEWQVNGVKVSDEIKPIIDFPGPGTYPVQLIVKNNAFDCIDTALQYITVFERPSLNDINDISYCEDQDIVLQFLPDQIVTITPSNLVEKINDFSYKLIAEDDGELTIMAENKNGCKTEKSIAIDVLKNEISDTVIQVLSCKGQNVKLPIKLNPGDSLSWTEGIHYNPSQLSCLLCSEPEIEVTTSGQIIATYFSTELCRQLKIAFDIIEMAIEIPNVFSPNGDNGNDVFRPVSIIPEFQDKITITDLQVFSRWGNSIYAASNTKGWDGNFNDQPASEEVYYFNLSYTIGPGCLFNKKGNVTLIR